MVGRLRKRLLVHGHLKRSALRREFDGVSQQVNQHLIQPHAVAVHIFRQDLVGASVERLIFRLDLGLDDIDNTVHHLSQRNQLYIQRHFPALDFGYIQHVVNQPQQMLAGQVDFGQIILDLLGVIRVIYSQGCHPDDGVHWGSYVMTHAGEKILLGLIGLLRLFSGPFRVPPGRIHLRVHALQLRHLVPEQLQILEEHVNEHGDDCERSGVNNGKPAAAHPRDRVVQPVKGEDRHQIPITVGEIGAVQVAA